MQVVKKVLFFLVLIWLGIVLFMPKVSLYFTLEKALAKEGVEINEKRIDEGLFTLTIEEPVIYVHGIRVAKLSRIRFFTLLFYTRAAAENMEVDSSLKQYVPEKITGISLTHQVFRPLVLSVRAEGDFGNAEGTVDMAVRKVHINVADSKKLGMLKKTLKKGKDGWYYETSF